MAPGTGHAGAACPKRTVMTEVGAAGGDIPGELCEV